jgi:hypothetical protein
MHLATGQLDKMETQLDDVVKYTLLLSENKVNINAYIGQNISIQFTGEIRCIECGIKTKKSFGNGFCYPCFVSSPSSAPCIIRPELCQAHNAENTAPVHVCKGHVTPHYVYISYTGGVKVGVTRGTQVPTRWIDQGATQACIIAETPYRQAAGAIEVKLKEYYADKTAWQKMLKLSIDDEFDLEPFLQNIGEKINDDLLKTYVKPTFEIHKIKFPLTQTLEKVVSHNFEKNPEIKGKLTGIKGQYLIFDNQNVVNIRTYSGYVVSFNID